MTASLIEVPRVQDLLTLAASRKAGFRRRAPEGRRPTQDARDSHEDTLPISVGSAMRPSGTAAATADARVVAVMKMCLLGQNKP
jgi:hypothetical protein